MTKLKNILVAAASILIFANITHAQALKASYSVNSEEPISVKYLGDDGNYLLFRVTLQSKSPANALFVIDDLNEGELYSSRLTAAYKVQTIKVEKRHDLILSFKLFLGRETYSKSFSVNTSLVQTTTEADSDITRL